MNQQPLNTLSDTSRITSSLVTANRKPYKSHEDSTSIYFCDKNSSYKILFNDQHILNLDKRSKIKLAHLVKFISIAIRDTNGNSPCTITIDKIKQYLTNENIFPKDNEDYAKKIAQELISIANIEDPITATFKELFFQHHTISQTAKDFITKMGLDFDKLSLKSQDINDIINPQQSTSTKRYSVELYNFFTDSIDDKKTYLFSKMDALAYKGEWRNHQFHGYGIISCSTPNQCINQLKYSGHFNNGLLKSVVAESKTSFMNMMSYYVRSGKYSTIHGASDIFLQDIIEIFIKKHQPDIDIKDILNQIKNSFAHTYDYLENELALIDPLLQQHAVLIQFFLLPKLKDTYLVSIYNSGKGLRRYHQSKQENGKTKYQTRQDYHVTHEYYKNTILPLINKNTPVYEFYQALEKGEKIDNPDYPCQTKQAGPNCALESRNAYLLNRLIEEFRKSYGQEDGYRIGRETYKKLQELQKFAYRRPVKEEQ